MARHGHFVAQIGPWIYVGASPRLAAIGQGDALGFDTPEEAHAEMRRRGRGDYSVVPVTTGSVSRHPPVLSGNETKEQTS